MKVMVEVIMIKKKEKWNEKISWRIKRKNRKERRERKKLRKQAIREKEGRKKDKAKRIMKQKEKKKQTFYSDQHVHLACYTYKISAIVTSGLLQASVVLSNLHGILNEILYSIESMGSGIK